MAVATRGVVMRELRRRESMRVALEVPWERQAILVRVDEEVKVLRCVVNGWEWWWRRLDMVEVATVRLGWGR